MKVIRNRSGHSANHKACRALVALAITCVVSCETNPPPESINGPGDGVVAGIVPDGWEVKRNESFSFTGPHDLIKVPVHGVDSFVGRLENREFFVSFDHGRYSDDSFDGHLGRAMGTFEVEEVRVNGKQARFGSYVDNHYPESHPFVSAAYFPDVAGSGEGTAGETKLYFRVCYKAPEFKEVARQILTSIRFND